MEMTPHANSSPGIQEHSSLGTKGVNCSVWLLKSHVEMQVANRSISLEALTGWQCLSQPQRMKERADDAQ